jgi:hypothetical protein
LGPCGEVRKSTARIHDSIRDNNIIREDIIDIKYSTGYIPEDKK